MKKQEMTPAGFIEALKRRKYSFILPALFVSITLVIIALALPPVYKSTSTILIEQQDIPADFVKTTVTTYAEQQLQIINQRIMTATKLLEIINRFELYKELRDKKTTEEVVDKMREDITMEPISVEVVDRRTGRPTVATIAFTVSYEGKNNPLKVQQIANVLASLFLEENVQVRERQANDISKFLEDELIRVKKDLDEIDARMAAFKENHINELPELLQVNMQTLNNLEHQKDLLFERLNHLREREESMSTELASIQPKLQNLDRKRLEELKSNLVFLQNRFSDEYPDVIKTKSEIAELQDRLKNKNLNPGVTGDDIPDNPAYITLSSQRSSTHSEIGSLKAQMKETENKIREYRSRIETTPKVEAEYMMLMAQRNNTQAKCDDLMRKVMEARVSQGLEKEQKGERFTLIEPARLPEKPFKPNRLALLLVGLVLGIGAGAATAAAREFLDDSVKDPDEVSILTSFPVLASIPVILTQREINRTLLKRRTLILGVLASIIIAALSFHFLIMDVDIFWIKLSRRLGI